jgi:serine/threonine-protein kinase
VPTTAKATAANAAEKDTAARSIGRYVLFREIAHGGMATVHLGRLRGPAGFARTVAIKRLHAPYARDPEFVTMFLEEARLAARIQHPNVVSVLDVVASGGELFLVMDYVHGESLAKMVALSIEQRKEPPPARIVLPIITSVLYGLHAAHEARNERGDLLHLVHRDVTPQNVLVGVDGVARVLDFGIAKAMQSTHSSTRDGQIKGKIPYMSPEQIGGQDMDRRADVYAASVILWETLTGQRLFKATDMIQVTTLILTQKHEPPSTKRPGIPPELDALVMRGLEKEPEARFASAKEMALALEALMKPATPPEVGEWVSHLAGTALDSRAQSIKEIEGTALPSVTRSDPAPRGSFPSLPQAVIPKAPLPPQAAEPAPVVPMRRFTLWPVVAGVGVVLVVGAIGGITCAMRQHPVAAATTATATAATTATGTPTPTPTAIPTAMATATASAAATATATASPPPTPVRPPRPVPRPNCNPPYTVDAQGIRIPKKGCY